MGGSWGRATAVIACVLLAGCGDEDKRTATVNTTAPPTTATHAQKPANTGPRPAETAQQAADRIAKAVRTNDCRSPRDVFGVGVTTAICRKLLPDIKPAPVPNAKAYGTGAVVKQADGGYTILALDHDRRFKVATSFGGSVRVATQPPQGANDTMQQVVGAIRRDSCDDLRYLVLTFGKGGLKKFCALRPVRKLHAALNRHFTATPKRLGGDGHFAFYGLADGPRYYTLIFIADKRTYLFVTSVEA